MIYCKKNIFKNSITFKKKNENIFLCFLLSIKN